MKLYILRKPPKNTAWKCFQLTAVLHSSMYFSLPYHHHHAASVFPTGIIKGLSYLTSLVDRCSEKQRISKKKKTLPPPPGTSRASTLQPVVMARCPKAWIMSLSATKVFHSYLCVCRSCGECGVPFSGGLPWTFSGSRWQGQMVWLRLPPPPPTSSSFSHPSLPPSTGDQTP